MSKASKDVIDARAANSKCGICRLGYEPVMKVNRLIAGGAPYTDVHHETTKMFQAGEIPTSPSYDSVRGHGMNHLPRRDDAIRRMLERHAIDAGIAVDNGNIESLIQPIVVAEETMRRGFQDLANGRIKPTVKEMLEASKMVNAITRSNAQNLDVTDALNQVTAILRVVQEVVPEQYWPIIAARLRTLDSPNPDVFRVEIEDAQVVD